MINKSSPKQRLFEMMQKVNPDFINKKINESKTSEDQIIKDILSSINEDNLDEGLAGDALRKIKDYGRKGLLTTTVLIGVLSGILNAAVKTELLDVSSEFLNKNQIETVKNEVGEDMGNTAYYDYLENKDNQYALFGAFHHLSKENNSPVELRILYLSLINDKISVSEFKKELKSKGWDVKHIAMIRTLDNSNHKDSYVKYGKSVVNEINKSKEREQKSDTINQELPKEFKNIIKQGNEEGKKFIVGVGVSPSQQMSGRISRSDALKQLSKKQGNSSVEISGEDMKEVTSKTFKTDDGHYKTIRLYQIN